MLEVLHGRVLCLSPCSCSDGLWAVFCLYAYPFCAEPCMYPRAKSLSPCSSEHTHHTSLLTQLPLQALSLDISPAGQLGIVGGAGGSLSLFLTDTGSVEVM